MLIALQHLAGLSVAAELPVGLREPKVGAGIVVRGQRRLKMVDGLGGLIQSHQGQSEGGPSWEEVRRARRHQVQVRHRLGRALEACKRVAERVIEFDGVRHLLYESLEHRDRLVELAALLQRDRQLHLEPRVSGTQGQG